ncbi:MAG: YeeE/YedE thiosulfate transporter family protein [Bermanella sp.]
MISALQAVPFQSVLSGGLLIGLAALLLFAFNGRIAGICGITFSLLNRKTLDIAWRWLFLAGLVGGTLLYHFLTGAPIPEPANNALAPLIAGGLLVGYGTAMGSGCTSGHGICGIARFSTRSITATVCFMVAGIVSLFVFKHLLGWNI